MNWSDDAIVLDARAQGESNAIGDLFTRLHGRQGAIVYGGQGKSKGPLLQPGNGVAVTWHGKGERALGYFDLELRRPRAAGALAERHALLGLTAVTDTLATVLPEGEQQTQLYDATCVILDHVEEKLLFPILLAKWEVGLLDALGFGLTLDRCAATGRMLEDGADLVFVSPKSGTAVSQEAGMPYKDKMLPLPPFLIGMGEPVRGDVAAALRMTGYFLEDRLLAPAGKTLPEARRKLETRL
ncbi:DNA repair protein RecO [Parvularcula dongshanensis]|uniref:DNA repair protein RecO n=1 Tax=Parvularcula dongshanensis TaxID=1173995 RepID=A0A840I277_9PROT|nr:DNA repair protein RecO (recombination protein O) [Parvularcula dongshanensis]